MVTSGNQSTPPLDLKTCWENILEDRKVSGLEMLKGNRGYLICGDTGAGKSTTICALKGDKMTRDKHNLFVSDKADVKIGSGTRSCTRGAYGIEADGMYFVDTPGMNDSEGVSRDISNAISIRLAWQALGEVVPILVIPYFTLESQRQSMIVPLLDFYADLLGNDEDAIGKTLFFITRLPESNSHCSSLVKEFFEELVDNEELSEGTFCVTSTFVDRFDSQVVFFQPDKPSSTRKAKSLLKKAKAVSTDDNPGQFSLPPEKRQQLESTLKDYEISIKGWASEGDAKSITDAFDILRTLSDELSIVKATLDRVTAEVGQMLVSDQADALGVLSTVINNREYWTEDIKRLNRIMNLKRSLAPLQHLLPSEWTSLEEFESLVISQLTELSESIREQTDFAIMSSQRRKLVRLCDTIELSQSVQSLVTRSDKAILAKIEAIQLAKFSIPTSHTAPADVSRDFTQFCRDVESLRLAEQHTADFLPEYNFAANRESGLQTVKDLLYQISEGFCSRAVNAGEPVEELKYAYTILQEASRHVELAEFIDKPLLQEPLLKARDETIERMESMLANLEQSPEGSTNLREQLAPLKQLREIDPEFEVALSPIQMRIFRQLGNKTTELVERFLEEMRANPVNGAVLQRIYQEIESGRWMDEYPTNLGRVASTVAEIQQKVRGELSSISGKKQRLFRSKNYDGMIDCCETLNQLELLIDSIPELRNDLEDARNGYVEGILSILQEVTDKCEKKGAKNTHLLDDEGEDVYTFKQAGRMLKVLNQLEPVAELLTLDMAPKSELEELITGKAKRLVTQIAERPEDFAFMAAVLEAMEILPKLSHIPENAQKAYGRARNAVISELEKIESEIDVLMSEANHPEAEKRLATFSTARRLTAVLSVDDSVDPFDISGKIKKLHLELVAGKKEVVDSIPLKFAAGQFQLLGQEISTLEGRDLQRAILRVQEEINKADSQLEQSITQFIPVPEDTFNTNAFLQISENLQVMLRCQESLNLEGIQHKDLKQKYLILDSTLAQAVEENLSRNRNGHFDASHRINREISRIVTTHRDALPLTADELKRYKKIQELEASQISADASFPALNTAYRKFKKSNKEHDVSQVQEAVREKVRKELDSIMEKATTSFTETIASLERFRVEEVSALDDPDLNTKANELIDSRRKELENDNRTAESRIDDSLATKRISEVKTLRDEIRQSGNRDLLRKVDGKLQQERSRLDNAMVKAISVKNLQSFHQVAQEYDQYENSCPEIFPPLAKSSGLSLLQKWVEEASENAKQHRDVTIDDSFPPSYFESVNVLLEVYRFPLCRDVINANILLSATLPVTNILGQIEDYETRGKAQYDLGLLSKACDACKSFDNLIRQFQREAFQDDSLGTLKRACEKAKTYQTLQASVSSYLKSLPSVLMEEWEQKHDPHPMERCLRSFKSSAFSRISKHIDDMTELKTTLHRQCEDIVKKIANECKRSKQLNNHDEFNRTYLMLESLKTVEQLQGTDHNSEIDSALVADIEQLVSEAASSKKVPELVDVLKRLFDYAEDRPAIASKCQQSINQLLQKHVKILHKIETELSSDGDRRSNLIIQNYPQFSQAKYDQWVQRTAGVTPEKAVQQYKTTGENPDSGWFNMESLGSLFGWKDDQQSRYLKSYQDFEKKFREFVTEYQVNPNWGEIRNLARSACKKFSTNSIPKVLAYVLGVWSLLKSNIDMSSMSDDSRERRIQPHAVQTLVLFDMLRQDKKGFISQLSQIKTGEGKSVILGTLSTVFALCGYHVNCICYSSYLSERDEADFKDIFDKFGVSDQIQYSNISDMCRSLINEQGDIKPLMDLYLKGQPTSNQQSSDAKKKRILLIDEVDVFFGTDFYGETFNPATRIQDACTYEIMRYIWKSPDATLSEVVQTPHFQQFSQQFKEWERLFKGEVSKMLLAVKEYKKGDPFPYQDKVAYAINGNTSTTTAYGYSTPFAYFHFHEKGQISDQSLQDNIGFHVVYGIFSYAEIPKRFDVVMGVSGTLTELLPEEKKILSSYNINKINLCASMYGENQLKFERAADVTVIPSYEDWMLRLSQNAQHKVNAGRAVIIAFRSLEILHDFEQKHKSDFATGSFAVLEESTNFKTNVIQKASKSGMVTLISRSFGRGSDFSCQDATTRSEGGVHVIQSFLSESAAEEIQIQGRTARQGDSGSYEMLIWEEDLINAGKSAEQIEEARSKRELYQMMCEIRDQSHAQIVHGLIGGEKNARDEHQRTLKLHKLLLDNPAANAQKIQNLILAFNGCGQTVKPYHFYFVLDDSGSMHYDWKHLMKALEAFVDRRIAVCNSAGAQVNDLATIVNYSHTAQVMCSAKPVTSDIAKHTKFRNGGTDFGIGLQVTLQEMSKCGSSYQPVLVFMSDGGSNTGDYEMQKIATDFEPVAFVFGFGKSCDSQRLKTLATLARGEYYEGANGAELKAAFVEVSTKVSTVSF